jgi:hypothetical protein
MGTEALAARPGSGWRLAVFVSPHGFGHAARTCAILDELRALEPRLEPVVFSTVPPWFFVESLQTAVDVRPWVVDVGVCQASPTHEDLPATAGAVSGFLDEVPPLASELAGELRALGCTGVLADIAPLGLRAAALARLPSVLLASFDWPWIYRGLAPAHPPLAEIAARYEAAFPRPDRVVELTPACARWPDGVMVEPVARRPRESELVRARLGLDPGRPLVVVSFGGIAAQLEKLGSSLRSSSRDAPQVVLLGSDEEQLARRDNLCFLPRHAPVFHPDLVAAADVLVGKLGYSTVAEAWHQGTRLLYSRRSGFPEAAVLERFVARELTSRPLPADPLSGDVELGAEVEKVLSLPRGPARPYRGARAAAERILGWLR